MGNRLVRRLLIAGASLLALGCRPGAVSREAYVRFWSVAELRAREKGTEPREELLKILGTEGIDPERFEEAQVRWFGEEANLEVRQRVRTALETENLPSRNDYVHMRVLAFLRSRFHGRPFEEEIAALGARFGFSPEAFRVARSIWAGDPETDERIEEEHARLRGALRVKGSAWTEITSEPEWSGSRPEAWLADALRRRGIDREDWEALEEVLGE